jgi:hypothetical protein
MVQQPGAADRVWWMDKEVGKVFGQLKAFSLTSPMRMAMRPAQMAGLGGGRGAIMAARFVGYMMIGGALVHVLRNLSAGKQPASDPATFASEAFAESGLGGALPDLMSPIARRLGMIGESARYSDRNAMSAFGGPAVGAASDAYDFLFNRTANGMSANDLHLLRRMLPYQNLWWLRRAINALEGETAEQLDLKGAQSKPFGQRVMETTPLLPPGQRGGTGTSDVVF